MSSSHPANDREQVELQRQGLAPGVMGQVLSMQSTKIAEILSEESIEAILNLQDSLLFHFLDHKWMKMS